MLAALAAEFVQEPEPDQPGTHAVEQLLGIEGRTPAADHRRHLVAPHPRGRRAGVVVLGQDPVRRRQVQGMERVSRVVVPLVGLFIGYLAKGVGARKGAARVKPRTRCAVAGVVPEVALR